MGSIWAQNTGLSIPNGPGSLSEKGVFDPFLTHCWSQSGPFSRHFGISHGPNASPRAQNGLKTLVCASQTIHDQFWKNAFLTHFWFQNGPFSMHFGILQGPNPVTTGSKWVQNTCLSIPNGPRSLLEKCVFDPFLTHCWPQSGPFSRHFGDFAWAENASPRAQNGLNMG